METAQDFQFNHDLLIEAVQEEIALAQQRTFSKSALARELGISRQFLDKLLKRQQSPGSVILMRIQRRFPNKPFLPMMLTDSNTTDEQLTEATHA